MPGEKNKETAKITKIPSKIIEAISSVYPDELSQNESCPSFSTKHLNIAETLEEVKKKKVEKEYKIGNYLIKKTLGQGTFGKVKLAIYLPNKEKVAIKILEKDRIIEKDDGIRVKREFDMLALFNHPNVILVAEIFESSDSYYSVMEYCQGGELFNYIVKNRRLSDEEASFFYFQLINGLEYLHSLGIVHRDLKPENLLLTNEHLLKIIDFGLSNYFHENQKNLLSTPCGSPCYASPEMVAGKKYNGFKIDIWSTGIILYAMLCGYLPFEDKDNDILFEKILECKLVFPRYISKNAKDLMEKILVTDPDKRITIPEIKKHPFYLSGKNLFEQDFSIYQINKDSNDKNNSFDNIDLNNILDTPELKESNNKEKNNDNKDILDVIENNINEKDNIIKDNGRKIKEIEIKLNNKKQDKIDANININNINTRDKTEEEEFNSHKKVKTYELQPNHPNFENTDKILPKDSNKENKNKNIIMGEKKGLVKSTNKSRSKGKNEKVKKLSLLKGTKNNERKCLIKNARKLNIRTGSKTFKTSKKLNDIINYNHFKNRLFQIKKLDIFSNIKTDNNLDKNSINKKIKLINKQFNSKESLNQKINLDNENINLTKINNNNTIDDADRNSKMKLKMNFHNLNFSSVKKNKKAKSISKNNMKLSIFEVSKLIQAKNNKNKIFRMNTSIKKNNKNKKFNLSNNIRFNNWHAIKYNLLHKKNLKEINMNLKKAKKIILSNEETKNEKKSNNKLYNTNTPTIDTTINNYNKINIIENPENKTNKENAIIKLTKKIINKKLPKKEKHLTKTIDREKTEHHTNKTSANLNSYLQNLIVKKTKKKLSSNLFAKEVNKNLNINIENNNNNNNNKKNHLSHLIDKNDNLDIFDNMLKTEPNQNQNKLIKTINQTDKKNMSSGKFLKETRKQFFQVKIPILNKNKQNKVNFIKKQKIAKAINNNKNKIPKNLNRTSNSNFHSFIQNPFTGNNPNNINKFFIHTNNGSFNQIEQNLSKKLNEKNNSNNNNLINGKKKPLVSIRNTVINFNMIDSGLILDSLKRKKKVNKLSNNNVAQNNSVNKLQNNHLFGLCSKFNSNISLNNNNQLLSNNDIYLSKTKTINVKNTNKKTFRYGENINNKLIIKKQLTNFDKSHVKYKSMRLEDYYSLKKNKNLKNINTNKIENTINDANKIMNIEMNHFNTINN